MKAQDLRIGNLVYDKHYNLMEVVSLDSRQGYGNVYKDAYGTSSGGVIKPIPLTEEWLIKMGFEKIGTNYEKDWLLLHGNIKTGTVDFLLNEPKTGKYKATILMYLHQLQNLYFALTGEELTINN